MIMETIKPRVFKGMGALSDMNLNKDYLKSLNVDPESSDDTQFNTERVYCSARLRTHATGWCTVSNALKLPVNSDLPPVYKTT